MGLFILSKQKLDTVNDMGTWKEGNWSWKFKWRKELFEWEKDCLGVGYEVRSIGLD